MHLHWGAVCQVQSRLLPLHLAQVPVVEAVVSPVVAEAAVGAAAGNLIYQAKYLKSLYFIIYRQLFELSVLRFCHPINQEQIRI